MRTQKRYQCRHIFTGGHRCGSPALLTETPQPDRTHEDFCYYHHTTRRPSRRATNLDDSGKAPDLTCFDLPLPEDRGAIQTAIGQVLLRLAANTLDPRRAGLLLYGLQIASLNLPPQPRLTQHEENTADTVTEIVTHPTLGPLAPTAELIPPPEHRSIGATLYRELFPEEFLDEPAPVYPYPADDPTRRAYDGYPAYDQPAAKPAADPTPTVPTETIAPTGPSPTEPAHPSILPNLQATTALAWDEEKRQVISTEAVDGLTVRRAVERPPYFASAVAF